MANILRIFLLPILLSFLASCSNIFEPTYTEALWTFSSSFESSSDFENFYIVPSGDYDSKHENSTEMVYSGTYAHKAWIVKARADNNDGAVYMPHRAYPTVQFDKTPEGIYRTPCLVTVWVNLDMTLIRRASGHIDDWFSFVTLTCDASDNWSRTVLVNIGPTGYIVLMHVPNQGEQEYIYQVSSANDPSSVHIFPQKTWVRLDVLIDFNASHGYAKVWQNGILVSHANVKGGKGGLAQAHFGLYASAAVSSGTIFNDDLRIKEIENENEA
ncbi:MAG: hypothetical protein A2096_08440, partial [Spirochaetes bacterium GWF1_41_5]